MPPPLCVHLPVRRWVPLLAFYALLGMFVTGALRASMRYLQVHFCVDIANSGALLTAFSLPWFSKPVWGVLSDSGFCGTVYRRRGLAVAGGTIAAFSACLLPLVDTLSWFTLLSFCVSLGSVLADVAYESLITDIDQRMPDADRGSLMGNTKMVRSLGSTVGGVAVGAILDDGHESFGGTFALMGVVVGALCACTLWIPDIPYTEPTALPSARTLLARWGARTFARVRTRKPPPGAHKLEEGADGDSDAPEGVPEPDPEKCDCCQVLDQIEGAPECALVDTGSPRMPTTGAAPVVLVRDNETGADTGTPRGRWVVLWAGLCGSLHDFGHMLWTTRLAHIAAFIMLTTCIPHSGNAMYYFLTEELRYSQLLLSGIGIVEDFTEMLGYALYTSCLRHVSVRRTVFTSNVLSAVGSVAIIAVVVWGRQWRAAGNGADIAFIAVDTAALGLVEPLMFAPVAALIQRVAPAWCAGTVYNTWLSLWNFGGHVAIYLSKFLLEGFQVHSGNYTHLPALIVLSTVLHLLSMVCIGCLPPHARYRGLGSTTSVIPIVFDRVPPAESADEGLADDNGGVVTPPNERAVFGLGSTPAHSDTDAPAPALAAVHTGTELDTD